MSRTETTIIGYWQRYPLAYFLGVAGIVFGLSALGHSLPYLPGGPEFWWPAGGFFLFIASQIGLLKYEKVYFARFNPRVYSKLFVLGAVGAVCVSLGTAAAIAFAAAAAAIAVLSWVRVVAIADPAPERDPGRLRFHDRLTLAMRCLVGALLVVSLTLRESGRSELIFMACALSWAANSRMYRMNGIERPKDKKLTLAAVALAAALLVLPGIALIAGLELPREPYRTLLLAGIFITLTGLHVWYTERRSGDRT